jgi:hypothetical protein
MSTKSSGRTVRSTLACSSRMASGAIDAGGSIARKPTICSRWFWITSRMTPVSS